MDRIRAVAGGAVPAEGVCVNGYVSVNTYTNATRVTYSHAGLSEAADMTDGWDGSEDGCGTATTTSMRCWL